MQGIDRAAALLAAAKRVVALTGAGISTESGVPGFRSPGGIWSRYDPQEFALPRFIASAEARRKYWRWGREFYPQIRDAEPNAGRARKSTGGFSTASRTRAATCVDPQADDRLLRSGDLVIAGNAAEVLPRTVAALGEPRFSRERR